MGELPFEQVEALAAEIPGWTRPEDLRALYSLALATKPLVGDIVEMGSWCGRSTVVLARAARLLQCRVWAVDLFPEKHEWFENPDGTFSFRVVLDGEAYPGCVEQTVWREPYLKSVLPVYERETSLQATFESFVESRGVTAEVRVHRGTSQTWLRQLPADARSRLAFIDVEHSYGTVIGNIDAVEAVLVPGGWLCFDDAFTSYPGVDKAIEERVVRSGRYANCRQATRKVFVAQRTAPLEPR